MQKVTRRSLRALTFVGLLALVVAAGSGAPAGASQTPGTWTRTGSMTTPREGQTAVLLQDGQVLLMGGSNGTNNLSSAELYDPAIGKFTATGDMGAVRTGFNATALPNGEALITGGEIAGAATSSAELFNPATGTFSPTGNMSTPREFGTATLISGPNCAPNCGEVLVAGGENSSGDLQSAELFDPATGTFSATGSMNVPRVSQTATGSMNVPRVSQTATLLQDGQVLMEGGPPPNLVGGTAELYNPATGTFTNTGTAPFPHYGPLAGLLPDGRVVSLCNISDPGVDPCGADIYDPASGTWSDDGIADATAQGGYTRTMLDNGQVLVSGGASQFGGDKNRRTVLSSEASLFDPPTKNATFTGNMSIPRDGHTLTLLPNGQVLAAGGYTQSNSRVNPKISVTASAELFTP